MERLGIIQCNGTSTAGKTFYLGPQDDRAYVEELKEERHDITVIFIATFSIEVQGQAPFDQTYPAMEFYDMTFFA